MARTYVNWGEVFNKYNHRLNFGAKYCRLPLIILIVKEYMHPTNIQQSVINSIRNSTKGCIIFFSIMHEQPYKIRISGTLY